MAISPDGTTLVVAQSYGSRFTAYDIGSDGVTAGPDASTRDRLSHVDQYYLRPDCHRAANAVDAQVGIGLAQLLGGGLVAAVEGGDLA